VAGTWGYGIMTYGLYVHSFTPPAASEINSTDFIFVMRTTTPNELVSLYSLPGGTFNANIEWGDGANSTVTSWNDADMKHTYATAGDHVINITGNFPNVIFDGPSTRDQLTSVLQLGEVGWTRLDRAFSGCPNLTSFTVGRTNTSAVVNTNGMFRFCTGLDDPNLEGIDTSNVTNMGEMFMGCSGMITIDLSDMDTSSSIRMTDMFNGCTSLLSLDLSQTDTTNVRDMSYMFSGCSSMTSIDLTDFDTSGVFNTESSTPSDDLFNSPQLSGLFKNCPSLTSLDVSGFDLSRVTNVGEMFRGCSGLTSLDVSTFDTSKCTIMGSMFRDCSGLTILDVSNFDTGDATSMSSMFNGCTGVTDIVGLESFDIRRILGSTRMVDFCAGVTLPTARYNSVLVTWAANSPPRYININFGQSKHSGAGTTARTSLLLVQIDMFTIVTNWIIADGGPA
jgi:surface protein